MSFKVQVHDLMKRPGLMREHDLQIVLTDPIGTEVVKVPVASVLEVGLRLESVHEGILASGELSAVAEAECSRCLDEIEIDVEVDFQELYNYKAQDEEEFEVVGEEIDLEQVIIDAIVLELPFQPVCDKGCLGLCMECGFRLSDDPSHAHEGQIDSRFEALKELLEKQDGDIA
jgi:uncharacterized protein